MRTILARRLIVVVDVTAALVLVLSGLAAIVVSMAAASWSSHFQSPGDPAEEGVFVAVGVGLIVLGLIRPLKSRRRAWFIVAVVATAAVVAPASLDGLSLLLFLAFLLGVLLSTRRQLEVVAARGDVLDSSVS